MRKIYIIISLMLITIISLITYSGLKSNDVFSENLINYLSLGLAISEESLKLGLLSRNYLLIIVTVLVLASILMYMEAARRRRRRRKNKIKDDSD